MKQLDKLAHMLEGSVESLFEALDINLRDYSIDHQKIQGSCPIHASDSQKFIYYFNSGRWLCMTRQCHKENGGNSLLDLIILKKDLDFRSAREWAQKFLRDKDVRWAEVKSRVRRQASAGPRDWMKFHHEQKRKITRLSWTKRCATYLDDRGLDSRLVRQFGAGEGLWRDRLVLPVRNIDEKVVGFTGRTLIDDDRKWLFPRKFKTSINLFNIDRASKWIRRTRSVLICEGPFDVINAVSAGYRNCVATLGINISIGQVELLKSCGLQHAIIGFDQDEAARTRIFDGVSRLESANFQTTVLRWNGDQDIGAMEPGRLHRIMKKHLGDLPEFRRLKKMVGRERDCGDGARIQTEGCCEREAKREASMSRKVE